VSITIVGFDSTNKIPGFFGETVYNAGPVTAGSIPILLLITGTQLSTGTATPNQDVLFVTSQTDADTFWGAGSEMAVQAQGALQTLGVTLWGASTAEAGGSAASTATITVTGTWSTPGTWTGRVDGVLVQANALATDTIQTFATSIAAAINSVREISVVAVVGAATAYVVTLTRKSKGARGNQGALYQVVAGLPSGMTVAIAGGAAMTGPGLHFTGGSGVDSVATLLASVIQATQFDRIAFAQNDATNAGLWHTFLNNQAAPLTGILQHGICCVTGSTFSAVVSLAQATLNAERIELCWQNDGETIPSFIAATFAAKRCAAEQNDPDSSFDGAILPGVAPQSQKSDWPNVATQIAALNSGVTPITTNASNQPVIIRAITTHSQDANGNPQYTTLDTSQAIVPDFVRLTARLYYTSVIKPGNPRVGPDPDPSARKAPSGILTPSLWRQQITGQLLLLEQDSPPILLPGSTAATPVVAEYDPVAKRIMSIMPVTPCPIDHQIGVSVRNVTSA
jgi:phage tail sheath gpL-like